MSLSTDVASHIPYNSPSGAVPRWSPTTAVVRHGATALAVSVLAFVYAAATSVVAQGPTDNQRMEQFLARLGLPELQITHLEQSLASPTDRQQDQQQARKLADLYAERLMAHSDDKPRYQDTLQRITALLEKHPQANTTALQVMLLQADYNRAESLIASWISEPQETAPRDEARDILIRITPQLVAHQTELNKTVEALFTQMDELPDGDLLQTKELELRRVQGIAARATYFAAWSNYYLGLVTGATSGAEPYRQARTIFLHLLGFDDQLPDDVEAKWLGLESIWRARAVIGLGLSLAACGDLDASERCFELLGDTSVPPEIKEQAPYWYVRALLNAGQRERAAKYARQKINYFQPPPTQGKVSLCVALVRAGFGAETTARNQQLRQLGDLGLNGLARLGQLSAINTLIEKFKIKPDANSGFVLLWAAGQQQFAAAEKSKQAADYQTAANTLLKATKSPDAKRLAGPAARSRYTLGWCYYRLNQFEQAAREFSNAFPGLHESKDSLAVESAWMAFAAYRKLAESEPRFATAAADAEKRLQRNFPKHAYAQRASYEMTKLLEKSDPDAMIKQLESIAPDDKNYAMARYDLCLLLYRLWTAERGDRQKGTARLEALRQAVRTYLSATDDHADSKRSLKACLLVANAALHQTPPQPDTAKTVLAQAAQFVSQLPDADPQVVEYHYRLLELAAAEGNTAQRQQRAKWIADHADGSPYERAALVIVANALDRQVRSASGSDRETLNRQAYSVYQRLADLLDTGEGQLAASKNAQVALSRLAHYALEVGQPAEAAAFLDRLVKIRPRDRRYLQRAAKAHSQVGQFAQALPHWRTLLSGLPSGSEAWYEAKYYQLEALARTNKERARKVYKQFKLLHPKLGGTAWQTKFTNLAKNW